MTSILKVDSIQTAAGKPILNSTGSILQIKSAVSTAASSISGTSFVDIPSMTATITPSASSSKILIQVSFGALGCESTGHGCLMKLFRDSTQIGNGTGADSHNVFLNIYQGATNIFDSVQHMFVDSPSSTSALVYKMQWATTGTGQTWYMNRRGIDNYARMSSTFLLTEIAG